MSLAKRIFDICFSVLVLLASSPACLLVAIAIKLESKGPVLFKQDRVGLNGRHFELYKFRTMVENAETIGLNLTTKGDPRITKVGKFLRKWKIDEIPQLINILKGEMSVVGPRPETPDYVELYTTGQRKVLSVRPGMAGPASIAYRNEEEEVLAKLENPREYYINHIMPDRLRLDLEYIEKQSLAYDFKLLFSMIKATLLG